MSHPVLTKFGRVISERGLLAAPRYLLVRAIAVARARYDERFDRRFGTVTSGVTPLGDLNIASINRSVGIRYEPISVPLFRRLLKRLQVQHKDYTFVDYGSGKGRALLLAAEYPFRRIVGVEFAPELHEAAAHNIAIFSNPAQKCRQIESICMDAVAFEPPPGPLMCFFYSPFRRQVLEPVLDRLKASIEARPREAVLIFHGSNPESIQLFKDRWPSLTDIPLPRDWTRRDRYRTLVVRLG